MTVTELRKTKAATSLIIIEEVHFFSVHARDAANADADSGADAAIVFDEYAYLTSSS